MHEHTVRATISTAIVEGFTRDGVNRWRSIPYAGLPVGPLRYRAPRPAESRRGVRYCHGFANCAPQQRKYTITGLGKYQADGRGLPHAQRRRSRRTCRGSLPVMVFVHGGAYILGSSATVCCTTVPRWLGVAACTSR